MPKVSVIIITYKRDSLLRRAITSVLNQTFQDFEIIVVDDASPDKTEEVVRSFNEARIKYVRHETNKGEGKARNTGLSNADGELIAFLDDDDEWLAEKLEMQVAVLDKSPSEVGGVYTGRSDIDLATQSILRVRMPDQSEETGRQLLKENCITVSSIVVRRICFERMGWFDESLPSGLDYDMWLRISTEYKLVGLDRPLVRYGIHANKLGENFVFQILGREAFIQKYRSWAQTNRKGYSRKHRELGILSCLTGNMKKGRRALIKAIQFSPLEVKPYLILIVSIFGVHGFRRVIDWWGNKMIGFTNVPAE